MILTSPRALGLEEDEIVHVFQHMLLLEQLVEHEFEFHFNLKLEIHGTPGHETVPARGQRAKPAVNAVRGDEDLVGFEQVRNLFLVGLELLVSIQQRHPFANEGLEFNHRNRQAIDVNDNVWNSVVPVLKDRDLIDGQPIVE